MQSPIAVLCNGAHCCRACIRCYHECPQEHRKPGGNLDDSVIISSGVLLIWLVTVTVFEAVYKPARQGRKIAYLTLASFVFLAASLVLCLWPNMRVRPIACLHFGRCCLKLQMIGCSHHTPTSLSARSLRSNQIRWMKRWLNANCLSSDGSGVIVHL